MDANTFRNFCLSLPGAYDTQPFVTNETHFSEVVVFNVGGKWFGWCDLQAFEFCTIKSAPENIEPLMETYAGIRPGYHMNKKHWISIDFESDVPDEKIFELVEKAYRLVVSKLPKKVRNELNQVPSPE